MIAKTFLVAVALVGAAIACTDADDQPADEVAAQIEQICRQANECNTLWDGDACTAYLDPCIAKLTPEQRADWAAQVDSCARANATCGAAFECYARVPWC